MKFIVDEYPNYNSDCPFYGKEQYSYGECKVSGCYCPYDYKNNENCALITFEDFMKNKRAEDD